MRGRPRMVWSKGRMDFIKPARKFISPTPRRSFFKSLRLTSQPVIPAKAGIQERNGLLDSRFRGNDKL